MPFDLQASAAHVLNALSRGKWSRSYGRISKLAVALIVKYDTVISG